MVHYEINRPAMPLTLYAELMGIPPHHFFGGSSGYVFNTLSGCSSVWFRHTWQHDAQVSHEELADEIMAAERQISELIGFPIVPMHIELDIPVPGKELRDMYGEYRAIPTNVGFVRAGGEEATELIVSGVPVVYTDEDGDQLKETGTIDASDPGFANWADDYGKLLVVPAGYGPEMAIDRYRKIENDNILVYSWNMIKPEIASRFPGNEMLPVNLDDTANLIEEVDIYRVYNDSTQGCQILFSDGTTQACTLVVEDVSAGIVRLTPSSAALACTAKPLRYQLSLYAGYTESARWSNPAGGNSDYPQYWANVVRMLATARLHREICGCNNVSVLAQELRTDMALVSPQGNFLAVADVIQECPLGTKQGEWLAWNSIKMFADKYRATSLVL